MDRDAQRRPVNRRSPVFERVIARMEEEIRSDSGSAPANYWLAAAARGAGDVDRAWDAAVAGWVRAGLAAHGADKLREDLDRLVTQALIVERARTRPAPEQQDAMTGLRGEWESLKSQWK